jgi:hypothetical protein
VRDKAFSSKAPTKISEASLTQKFNNSILRKTKPKRKQHKEENKNNITNNIATVKTACDALHYRRNQKYSRTLSSVAHCFRARKTKASPFQDLCFCFFVLSEAFKLLFLYPHNAEFSGSF